MIPLDYFWINIFFLTIGTISIRGSIIALSTRVKISDQTKELFTYIPAAILPALIAPALFFHQGIVPLLYGKERFVVAIFATLICYFTRSTLATIGLGLATLYALTQ